MDKMNNQELISAMADGQLRGDHFAQGVRAASDPAGQATWHAYHLIGDVLRTGQAPLGTPSADFVGRLRERLAQESVAPAALVLPATGAVAPRAPAANDWLWKLAAGVASVAAVAAIGWNVLGTAAPQAAAGPQLAVAPAAGGAQALAVDAPGPLVRDARLDQFLAAHRQFGGATALQNTSGFLRNATFEGPAR